MSSFKGSEKILLQPSDLNVTYEFEFTICSSVGAGDGGLPFEAEISGVVASTMTEDGTIVTDIIDETALTGNILSVTMSYPTSSTPGYYQIKFVVSCTTPTGLEREFDFTALEIGNIGY